MPRVIEVFADVTCPFTHVGLRMVAERLGELGVHCLVRAWPLEWVNGEPLAADAVAHKVEVLRSRLGPDLFVGFDPAAFPQTTIPALNLTAAGYSVSPDVGFAVARGVRNALFEHGRDIGDPQVLASLAADHGLAAPPTEANAAVVSDHEEGVRRGVQGSPDFFVGSQHFFCPALDIGHDEAGGLVADLDIDGLTAFFDSVRDDTQG